MNHHQCESTLLIVVDLLLPGDEAFPPASVVGVQRLLADRIRSRYGEQQLERMLELIVLCGGPLEPLDNRARVEVVRRLERDHGDQFARLRNIAYLSYYESAEVVRTIKKLGHDYNARPQPDGYRLPAFDCTSDAPTHQRGHYLSTKAVSSVHGKAEVMAKQRDKE